MEDAGASIETSCLDQCQLVSRDRRFEQAKSFTNRFGVIISRYAPARRLGQTERASLFLVDRSAGERFHKTTVTRAFRHSGGHAGPFGRVTSYIGCLVTSVVWVPVNTRMATLAGVKSGKDTGQVPVAEVQVVLLVDPSGAVTTTVTGV
jgi:hypothetical protein